MPEKEKPAVRLVGRDGRRRYDPAWKVRLVAFCVAPGVSVSRVALDHGLNANLLREWIKVFKDDDVASASLSAFVPVQVTDADHSRPILSGALDMAATRGDERPLRTQGLGVWTSPAKVSASLPNGVKLTLECGDGRALASIIGALGHV